MKRNKYTVILTNDFVNSEYKILASNEEQAIILAQAEAIKQARGYKFVSIIKEED